MIIKENEMNIFKKAASKILNKNSNYDKVGNLHLFIAILEQALDEYILPSMEDFKNYPDEEKIASANDYLHSAYGYIKQTILELKDMKYDEMNKNFNRPNASISSYRTSPRTIEIDDMPDIKLDKKDLN